MNRVHQLQLALYEIGSPWVHHLKETVNPADRCEPSEGHYKSTKGGFINNKSQHGRILQHDASLDDKLPVRLQRVPLFSRSW